MEDNTIGRSDQLYARLPVWAQHGAVSAFGLYWNRLRFGAGFQGYVDDYASRDRFTAEEWQAWQQQRLAEVLQVALTQVPYYQQAWSEQEKAAAAQGRLQELPLLTKEPLRANAHAFVRQDIPAKSLLTFHTSGSTGTPVATIWTAAELRRSLAVREVRSCGWAGVSFKTPRATFSGRMVVPDPNSKGPFHRWNSVEHQAYLSAFHLRPDTAPHYVEALKKHGVQWLTGYAVSFYLLAKFMLEQDLKVPGLKAIVTTSEKVTPEMRKVMEAAYGCRVYEEYSTVENCLFASECSHGRLHMSPDVAIVEILRADGSACEPGEAGEVVATCLMRDTQPLIRYRLGDMASWDDTPCACGRAMPIIKEVVGRVEDVVVGPDGRQMVRFHGIFVDQPHVREGQIIQETLNRIRVKVVPAGEFGTEDISNIIARVQQRLGPEVEVIVEPTESIPRTKSGKFQAVVSLLDKNGTAKVAEPAGSR